MRAHKLRLALYQPDIAANLGAAIRIAACFDVPLEVIEPCGFPLTDRAVKRAAMDYAALAQVIRQPSWTAFLADPARAEGRLVLFTTKGGDLPAFAFAQGDTLLFGRESAGAPQAVFDAANGLVRIPMAAGARALNVAVAAGIGVHEALRQIAAGANLKIGN